MAKYKITCLDCGESDIHTIDELNHRLITSEKKILTPLLTIRWRGDNSWGYQCICGNDNRLAASEMNEFEFLVAGDPISVKKIKDSVKRPDNKQFKMEPA